MPGTDAAYGDTGMVHGYGPTREVREVRQVEGPTPSIPTAAGIVRVLRSTCRDNVLCGGLYISAPRLCCCPLCYRICLCACYALSGTDIAQVDHAAEIEEATRCLLPNALAIVLS
eukprot:1351797-Rhodomonas_salina.3